ncbi:MAG: YihY/virulence factor BrkB family protein [Acidiferrobacterales bacterium]
MKLNPKQALVLWTNLIWETRREDLPRWLRPFLTALRIAHLLIRDLLEGQLTLRSMSLVYTTFLATVPLLALSFSVLKAFGVHNQLEPVLKNFLAPLGPRGVEITQHIIGFVDNIRVGVLGTLGLVLLVYTVISLLQKIERAFNFTWRVSEHRPFSQRFSDYLSVILIGPVLVFTAIGITASVSSAELVKQATEIKAVSSVAAFMGTLVPYLLIILAFTLIYIFVPNTKVKPKSALIGGIVSGLVWETTGWGFTAFVVNSTKYTAIYSAFATLIIFMIWLYLSWLILLIGGSVAFYHQHPEHRNLQSRILRLSNRMREKVSLLIMSLVGQHYYYHKTPWTLDDLAQRLNVGVEACNLLISNLENAGMLIRVAGDVPAYVPGQALDTLSLGDLVKEIRRAGETSYLRNENLPELKAIDELYGKIETAIDGVLENHTLKDISKNLEEPPKSQVS